MTKLSLCTIVKNEEISLPQCLKSVKDIVDEMIVLDTGSSDRTPEIAQELGAKVYHFEWSNDFAVARNEALKYVTGEWVLVLDADEVLTPEIVPLLKSAIAIENNLVVNLIRQEVGAAQSPYSLVSRLFRRHPQVIFSRPYHAIVDDAVVELIKQENQWQVVNLDSIAILHYGYQDRAIASLDKYTRARTMMEKFIATHPHDPYVCSKLGALYLQLNQVKGAIKFLKQGLKSNQAEAPVLFELYYSLGNAYVKQKDYERAESQYEKAIAQPILDKLKIGAYNNLASLLENKGDLDKARQVYQTVLQIDPNFSVGYYNLGMTLRRLGKVQGAIKAYKQAIKLDPNYALAYQNLGVALYKSGYMEESIEAFKNAIALLEKQNGIAATELKQGLNKIGINLH